jgi:Ca2+-binding RTX toxin-like protein
MGVIGALLPALAAASSVRVDGVVTYVPPSTDPNNPGDYWQVNGTSGDDQILLTTLEDGSVLAVRIAGEIEVGEVPAEQVATHVVVVAGGDGDDTINAAGVDGSATLEIHGGAGNDAITGSVGSDYLMGEAGDDTIDGGPGWGFDTILGGAGYADQLYAGPGGASIGDDDGVAVAQGGDGDDTISVLYDPGWVDSSGQRTAAGIVGGGGNDYLVVGILTPLVGPTPPLNLSVDGEGTTTGNPGIFNTLDIWNHNLLDPASPALTRDPRSLHLDAITLW